MLETTKQCSDCKTTKNISEFYKDKSSKDKLLSCCKKCIIKKSSRYHHTKNGIITQTYASQKTNSKQRGHRLPEYTKKELYDWLYSQELFHKLFNEWKMSGYKKRLTPSVDRKNDDIHYCMNNIQLMSWGENWDKSHRDMKSGKIKNRHKRVLQYTKDGEFVSEYFSMMEAKRQTGIEQGNISKVCSDEYKSAGGFIWKFKKEIL